MGFVVQGVEFELAAAVRNGRFKLPLPRRESGQLSQNRHHLQMMPFPLQHQPFRKSGAIGQIKTVEQFTPIQRSRFGQTMLTRRTGGPLGMFMALASSQQPRHLSHINPSLLRPQPNFVTIAANEIGRPFPQHPPQPGQRHPQIVTRLIFSHFRPQQPQQHLATVPPLAFQRQIRQQRNLLPAGNVKRNAINLHIPDVEQPYH